MNDVVAKSIFGVSLGLVTGLTVVFVLGIFFM